MKIQNNLRNPQNPHILSFPARLLRLGLLGLAFLLAQGAFAQTIRYVQEGGTGTGSSWADASGDLQAMINASASGDEVWVAAGTYKPTTCNPCTATDRAISFVMKNNLDIFGGLAGNEPSGYDMSLRDFTANETILSGDIGTVGNNGDNSYHVISNNNNGLNSTAVLDGFAITGGNANGSGSSSGGGMYNNNSSPTVTNCSFSRNNSNNFGGGMSNFNNSSPTVTNCSFSGNNSNNDGGGMYNFNNSSPTVTNCSFSGNSADSSTGEGGGMSNSTSSPTVTNCSFSGNSASRGGGMYNQSSFPTVTNCSFSGNTGSNNASGGGGGMYNNNSSPMVTNCSFSGNNAGGRGGGMYNSGFSPTVTNCILWGNSTEILNDIYAVGTPTITYSIVQGSYVGIGNLDVDPLFVSQPPIGLRNLTAVGGSLMLYYNFQLSDCCDITDLLSNGRGGRITGHLLQCIGLQQPSRILAQS
ncbi:MAG: hypothetical protein R2788_08745 [Saprospiraceae bacterium]